jgi:hypothetical protein
VDSSQPDSAEQEARPEPAAAPIGLLFASGVLFAQIPWSGSGPRHLKTNTYALLWSWQRAITPCLVLNWS